MIKKAIATSAIALLAIPRTLSLLALGISLLYIELLILPLLTLIPLMGIIKVSTST